MPRNSKEARTLDARNGNTKWQDAEVIEREQLFAYDTFKDLGVDGHPPKGYQKS